MAPIVFAVRSAILHAAPSRNKRAPSATKNRSILIGIIVPVVLCELAIGALCCFFIWRATRVRKTASPKQFLKLDTNCARQELKCEKPTLELSEASAVLEVGVATFRYSAPPSELHTQIRSELPDTVISELATRADSGSTKKDRLSTPERLCGQDWGIEQVWSPIEQVQPPNVFPDSLNVESSNVPEVSHCQQSSQSCVNPFDVEHHLNPIHFPFPAGPPSKLGEFPHQKTYFPNTEWEQVYTHFPPAVESDISDMEMPSRTTSPNPDGLHVREAMPDRDRVSMDIEQGEISWSSRNDLMHGYSDPEVQTQIYRPKSPLRGDVTAVDVILTSPPKSPPMGPNRVITITPEPPPHLAPRKRAASRDLRPLRTDNAKIEPSNKHDGIVTQRSKNRKRPNPRTLMPKDVSPQNLKVTSSPQSSKCTPDSAKTDLSFASTVTQAVSPGSSAITTPSAGAESPANPFSPQENTLVCQTCGQIFQTPGRQK
ncbi:unnamed protein product [Alternaria alternata]